MKLRTFVAVVSMCTIGLSTLAFAASDDFNSKKTIIENIVTQRYTGPESINVTISEKELRENWLPEVNKLFEKENTLKGSYFKDIELNSDGSIKATGFIGQGIKNIVKIPFFSTAAITFKPTADNGNLKIQVTKIKVGFFPISTSLAQKLLSRWNIDINNFVVSLKNFSVNKLTIDNDQLSLEGIYSAPIKARFSCRGTEYIEATFYKGKPAKTEPGQMPIPTGSIKVSLSDGRKFELPQTVSADGARYANSDETIIFWNKGDVMHFYDHKLEKGYSGCKFKK